jgi:hypothetical protein
VPSLLVDAWTGLLLLVMALATPERMKSGIEGAAGAVEDDKTVEVEALIPLDPVAPAKAGLAPAAKPLTPASAAPPPPLHPPAPAATMRAKNACR